VVSRDNTSRTVPSGGRMGAVLATSSVDRSGPRTPAESGWIRGLILVGIAMCGVLSAAFVVQLWRMDAISGGRHGRSLYPGEESAWLHVLVNHVTVSGFSRAADTLAPVLLLALAGWLSLRWRRWAPLVSASAAMVLVVLVLVAGKGLVGRLLGASALTWSPTVVSGPATAVVVVGGMAAWLLRGYLGESAGRALWGLAAAVALAVGVAQLYLGHRLDAVLLSWLCGIGVLGAVLLVCTRPGAQQRMLPR
jgi:hypothetical protein